MRVEARRRRLVVLAGAACVAFPVLAAGPARIVRLVVPQAPGDVADTIARAIAPWLGRGLAQEVVVENRAGAAGTAGAAAVAQAAPDALTLLLGQTVSLAAAPFALEKPPFDPVESFTHVAALAAMPLLIVSGANANLSSWPELEARARKGPVAFGSPGPFSLGHLYGELVRQATGLNLVHAPPRSGSLLEGLNAGSIAVGIDVVPPYVGPFQSGHVVPIAVSSPERSALLPDVPSVLDFGARNLLFENLYGLSAPARLPPGHSARIFNACQQALAQPDVQRRIAAAGARAQLLDTAALTAHMREQASRLAPVVRASGVRL